MCHKRGGQRFLFGPSLGKEIDFPWPQGQSFFVVLPLLSVKTRVVSYVHSIFVLY